MHFGPGFAVAVGVLFAVLVGSIGSAHAAWDRFANLFALQQTKFRHLPLRKTPANWIA